MKKVTLVLSLSLSLISFYSIAQNENLVPNAGFENYSGSFPCNYIYYKGQFDDLVDDWFLPTNGTSDVYSNKISSNCNLNVSVSGSGKLGYTIPKEGNHFAGLATIDAYQYEYREYLMVKLTKPLQIGDWYHAEMWVSHADLSVMATNGLGFLFTMDEIYQSGTKPIIAQPQVYSKDIILFSNGWVKIEGNFQADQPYEYVILGNFFSDLQTEDSILQTTTSSSIPDHGYYYIDEVKVHETCAQSTGLPDTAYICAEEDLKLLPNLQVIGNFRYQWNTGATQQSITVSDTGQYTVEITDGICFIYDTIQIMRQNCTIGLFPNIVTPNNDGINDRFEDRLFEKEDWDLSVYNRFGTKVYFNSPYKNDWDIELPDGIYYYVAESSKLRLDPIKGWFRVSR